MRRKQFAQLISDVRAELERSSDPAVGVSDLATLKQKINRTYETLYCDYDWPHLNQLFDKIPLNPGQRYYDFPEEMDYDRLERVVVWYNGRPYEIQRGIDFEQYALFDSESDERSDPVQRWDIRFVDTLEMVEVWPIPAASTAQHLQFKGTRKFEKLVNDADLCLLDDNLVVTFTAAGLAPAKSPYKSELLAAGQTILSKLRGRSQAGSGRIKLGAGESTPAPMSRAIVRVSG